jgi:hypothetical protein
MISICINNGKLNSCSLILSLQIMHCLKSVTLDVILPVLLLDEHLSQTISRCSVALFGTFLSGYALLNDSRTAADDVDVK